MRRFKSLLLILPMALMLNTCAAPAYALTDGAEETPPTETQPVETPSTEMPPVETPPMETPPTETPPTEAPPAETAPTETQPTEVPPTEMPPAETQPVEILSDETWSQLLELLLDGTLLQDVGGQPQGCGNCTCGGAAHVCDCCTCGDHQTCECCGCEGQSCCDCPEPEESAPVTTTPQPTKSPSMTTTPKPVTTSPTTTTPKPVETSPKSEEKEPEETSAQPLTPDGNMELVDDIEGEAGEDKQFIVVQSRGGHYFYIIVDGADEGENTVHFLNQVDEADLLSIIEEEDTAPAVCTCTEKCAPGAVNTSCEICAVNMGECAGKEPEPEETEPPEEPEPEPEPVKKSGTGPLLIVLVLAVAGVGAVAYLKFFKKKAPDTRGTANLDDYDYGTDDEDEDEPEDSEE